MAGQRQSPRVLIIGAGVIGSACAAALAEAGYAVTVVHDPARNTAEASGGHLLLQSKSPGAHLDLARRSLELLEAQIRGHEAELGYRQTGSLLLAVDDEEEALLATRMDQLSKAGLPIQPLSGHEARKMEPALSAEVTAASLCLVDAQIDPTALRDFWRQKASASGAEFVEAVVDGLQSVNGRPAAKLADQVMEAEAMVLAAGAWTRKLTDTLIGPVLLRPRRGLLLHSTVQVSLAWRPLLGAAYFSSKFVPQHDRDPAVAFSLQQHPDGRVVLGGTREFAGFDSRIEPKHVESVAHLGANYVPALERLTWTEATIGYRPWTPIGMPYVCDCEAPGLFLACGHEGDGITLAAATAEIITEKVSAYLNL